jgi:hypothetical protein
MEDGMSNQRTAKMHRAAMGQDGRVSMYEIIDFMESAANALAKHGEEDAAFYFQQVHEHLRRNPQKGFKEEIGRILGV